MAFVKIKPLPTNITCTQTPAYSKPSTWDHTETNRPAHKGWSNIPFTVPGLSAFKNELIAALKANYKEDMRSVGLTETQIDTENILSGMVEVTEPIKYTCEKTIHMLCADGTNVYTKTVAKACENDKAVTPGTGTITDEHDFTLTYNWHGADTKMKFHVKGYELMPGTTQVYPRDIDRKMLEFCIADNRDCKYIDQDPYTEKDLGNDIDPEKFRAEQGVGMKTRFFRAAYLTLEDASDYTYLQKYYKNYAATADDKENYPEFNVKWLEILNKTESKPYAVVDSAIVLKENQDLTFQLSARDLSVEVIALEDTNKSDGGSPVFKVANPEDYTRETNISKNTEGTYNAWIGEGKDESNDENNKKRIGLGDKVMFSNAKYKGSDDAKKDGKFVVKGYFVKLETSGPNQYSGGAAGAELDKEPMDESFSSKYLSWLPGVDKDKTKYIYSIEAGTDKFKGLNGISENFKQPKTDKQGDKNLGWNEGKITVYELWGEADKIYITYVGVQDD